VNLVEESAIFQFYLSGHETVTGVLINSVLVRRALPTQNQQTTKKPPKKPTKKNPKQKNKPKKTTQFFRFVNVFGLGVTISH